MILQVLCNKSKNPKIQLFILDNEGEKKILGVVVDDVVVVFVVVTK